MVEVAAAGVGKHPVRDLYGVSAVAAAFVKGEDNRVPKLRVSAAPQVGGVAKVPRLIVPEQASLAGCAKSAEEKKRLNTKLNINLNMMFFL
jgi:hypothetical protein